MRILVIEDDPALGMFLKKGMQMEGHDVTLAVDGENGLAYAIQQPPDLMVLDLGLPRKDGVQVLEQMRGHLAGTSVLVLTGRSGVEDRVQCLNLGADDCLIKPFSLSELMARSKALLRRRVQFANPVLTVGDLELNRMDRSVRRAGQMVELTAKEFALLEHLMRAVGRTCNRTELLREVWQATPSAGTNVVDVYINYLRKKLAAARLKSFDGLAGDQSDNLIETVRGEGYTLSVSPGKRPPAAVLPDSFGSPQFAVGSAWRMEAVARA